MKKIISILICIILLFTGCNKSNSKQEEKEVENTVSEYFNYLKNQDFDKANALWADNKGLFDDRKIKWLNDVFYNNLNCKIKNTTINKKQATTEVVVEFCNIPNLTNCVYEKMQENKIDLDSLSKDEEDELFSTYFSKYAKDYMIENNIKLILNKENDKWIIKEAKP